MIIAYSFKKSESKTLGHVRFWLWRGRPVLHNSGAVLSSKTDKEKWTWKDGTCTRMEISQDTDNAAQKVKWFLKIPVFQKMYLSLVEGKIKTIWPIFKILLFPSQDFSNLNSIYYFLFFVLIWPSYVTFKFDFCFKNRQRSLKTRYFVASNSICLW